MWSGRAVVAVGVVTGAVRRASAAPRRVGAALAGWAVAGWALAGWALAGAGPALGARIGERGCGREAAGGDGVPSVR